MGRNIIINIIKNIVKALLSEPSFMRKMIEDGEISASDIVFIFAQHLITEVKKNETTR